MSVKDLLRITDKELEGILKLRTRKEEDLKSDVKLIKDWWKKQAHLPKTIESMLKINIEQNSNLYLPT